MSQKLLPHFPEANDLMAILSRDNDKKQLHINALLEPLIR